MGNSCCANRDPTEKSGLPPKKGVAWKPMSKARLKDLSRLYKVNLTYRTKGNKGNIYEATMRNDPSQKIAIKIIQKRGMNEDELLNLIREVEILRKVDHMNIVKYLETYDEADYIYLCMELIEGQDLLQKVIETKAFTELEASRIML
jgi:serine/threonine protein kinase